MNDLDRLLGARDTNRCEIQIYNYHNLFFIFEQKKRNEIKMKPNLSIVLHPIAKKNVSKKKTNI